MENFGGAFESRYGPPAVAKDVLELWVAILRDETPWSEMYLDDISGRWRRVVGALFEDTVSPAERRHHLRRAARRHGEFRRGQRCDAQDLAEEVSMLEEAVGEVMHRSGASPRRIEQALYALAPDLRSICRAVYAGYVDGPSPRRLDVRSEKLADPDD
ncbi:MAG TPA: hypothetical protein VIP11_01935 [Gemmatimonadaceae bacterium]